MLSITSTPAIAWPTATPVAVAPVAAVASVTPAAASKGSARDTQSGAGFGREGRGATGRETAAAEAAPLLPRERPDKGQGGQAADETGDAAAQAEQRLAQDQAADQAQAQAQEQALRQQLQEVLSTVWKASAAVVEPVLDSDETAATTASGGAVAVQAAGAAAAASNGQAVAAPTVVPAAGAPATSAVPDGLPERRALQEVVAYDERGNSSWASLEAGSLIDRRV